MRVCFTALLALFLLIQPVVHAYEPITTDAQALQILKAARDTVSRCNAFTGFAFKGSLYSRAAGEMPNLTTSILQGRLVVTKKLALDYVDTLKVFAEVYLSGSRFIFPYIHSYGGLLTSNIRLVPSARL